MNLQEERITIVTVCDKHYLILLAALIKSIEINNKNGSYIDIYIVGDGLDLQDENKLVKSSNSGLVTLLFLKMKDVIPKGIKLPLDSTSYPLNIYVRLFIPHFIPPSIEKVLYMDVDMIVEENISKLWKINLHGLAIAAVLDSITHFIGSPYGGIKNYAALGLDPKSKYFNSGLFLINAKKWRESDITTKIIDCIKKNKKYVKYPDQYGLNVIFENQWLEIDPRWNCYVTNWEIRKPFIIHYIRRKPFYSSYNNRSDYQKKFYSYLNLTEWNNAPPVGEITRYIKKLHNVFAKLW